MVVAVQRCMWVSLVALRTHRVITYRETRRSEATSLFFRRVLLGPLVVGVGGEGWVARLVWAAGDSRGYSSSASGAGPRPYMPRESAGRWIFASLTRRFRVLESVVSFSPVWWSSAVFSMYWIS